MKTDLQKILKNERGVALMMIMTAIILLMAIYGEFTFDSKISRMKATNLLDRAQAKLLAESGLQMGMVRLRLYKEAYNYLQTNATLKQSVPSQLLNQLWEVPYIFPLPVGKEASRTFKDAAEKFTKDSLLDGEMKVTIQNISSRMNINLMRVDFKKMDPNNPDPDALNSSLNLSDQAITSDVSVDQTLYYLLKRLVTEKSEKDEGFADRNGNINYQALVTNLKYYISDYQSMVQDPLAGESEATYQRLLLTPKYGPMGSLSEFYVIPGWTDELIELIQNEFSVFPAAQIDLNKLTSNMLKILLPNLQDSDIAEFFTYRDNPQAPKFFNTKDDLKKYFVEQERILDGSYFDQRMEMFEKKGVTFGSNPNLFKVVSEGTFNRSTFTLVAFVLLPTQEQAPATNTNNTNNNPNNTNNPNQPNPNPNTNNTNNNPNNTANQSAQLLEPRIIEMQIN